jgi:hypothetical protein
VKIFALANLYVFVIAAGIGVFIGFDLKKWPGWLLGLYGFLTGCFSGFLRDGGSFDILEGFLIAFVVLSSGAMVHWQRLRYSKAAESWLSRQGEEKQYSFLARMIKRMLKK